MPEWTDHDREQYEAIKSSLLDDGKAEDEAKEIAARTVNQRRQDEGRTPNETTQGTGNPNTPLDERTVEQLRNRAAELDIDGRSDMTKDELVEAIREKNG